MEHNAAPVSRVVESLADDPAKLALFRAEYDALIAQYLNDNIVRMDFLMSRAVKV
jgi:hypothetical protein